jgi:flagellar assembly protein FliH
MSSSKIYKDDQSFTPVSLISKEIHTSSPAEPQPSSQQSDIEPSVADSEQHATTIDRESSPTASQPPAPDIDAIRAEAYEQGKQEAERGNLESEQALRTKLQKSLEAFTRACAEVDNLHQDLLEQSRGDMINLVIALSKKIIGRELTTGRDVIVDTLRNAIALAMKHNEYDIWLNPEDLTVVEELVPELISSVQQLKQITLKTDPEIARGGCRLDSDICTVDATIEAQLETARDFLEENSPNYNGAKQQDTDVPEDEPSDEQ